MPLSSNAALLPPTSVRAVLTPTKALVEAPNGPSADSFAVAAIKPRTLIPEKPKIVWGGSYKAGEWYPWGWCTYEVARLRKGVRWPGDARQWLANAKAAGMPTGNRPRVGAIMVEGIGYYGHVSYVTEVRKDGFTVQEMNYKGFGVTSRRDLSNDFKPMGFIY